MLSRFERTRILNQQRQMRDLLLPLTNTVSTSYRGNRFDLLFRFLIQFELLAASLYRLRTDGGKDPLQHSTEDLLASASRDLFAFQADKKRRSPQDALSYRYRCAWREHFPLFLYTLAMFVVAGVVGWNVGISGYEYASILIPQPFIEHILGHQRWFDEIQKAPLLYGITIAKNNIGVAVHCFTLAALAGLGGVYILVLNGLFFGAVLGFCQANKFDDALLNFVVGHGVLELTIIVSATFAGLIFGRVFYMRPYRLFKARLAIATRHAATVLLGLCPWLLVAAGLEVFVSPWPFFHTHSKILIGMLTASAFWLWTLWPLPQARSDARMRA
jgi:uncharacterized membrane protein SpoIIM required for sporulation